jgi:probable HAF family extracellular repeat protein
VGNVKSFKGLIGFAEFSNYDLRTIQLGASYPPDQTYVWGINDNDQVAGNYVDDVGIGRGFVLNLDNGLDIGMYIPGLWVSSSANGINDAGQVVGGYTHAAGITHGFVWTVVNQTAFNYTTIDVPGSQFTRCAGINEAGQIVGIFADAQGKQHTFLAAPVTASFIWTGGASDSIWSDGKNCLNGVVPAAGADLLFPSGAQQLSSSDDLGLTFNSITIQDNYAFSANGSLSTSNLTVQKGSLKLLLSSATVTGKLDVMSGTSLTLFTGGLDLNGGETTVEQGASLDDVGSITIEANSSLNDQGIVTVERFHDLVDKGSMTVATTGVLNYYGGFLNTATVDQGAILVVSGQVIVGSNQGTVAIMEVSGMVEITAGGALIVTDNAIVGVQVTCRISDQDCIKVAAGATVDVFGRLTEGAGGGLDDFAILTIEQGATLDIIGSVTIETGATYNPLGTVLVEPGGILKQPLQGTPFTVSCLAITAIAGAPFSGVVASFTDSDGGTLNNYTATLAWGDGTTSTGSIAANGTGGFNVSGSHTYATHGSFTLTVEVDDTDGTRGKGTCSLTASAAGQFSSPNQNAIINFWAGTHGQALIESFNSGSSSTALSNWLATSFPNLYGTNAGANNLTGKTNAQIAALFLTFYAESRPKPDAQALTLALNIYATTTSLGGTAGTAYGFSVTSTGLGASFVSLGANGAVFGAPNNVAVTAYYLLLAANNNAVNGVLYSGNSALLQEFLNVVIDLNDTGMNG